MLFRATVLAISLVFSSAAPAELWEWTISNVRVKDVIAVHIEGTSVLRVVYEAGESSTIKSGVNCAPNLTPVEGYPNRYQASYWTGSPNSHYNSWQSALLTAQAFQTPVDIRIDWGGPCNKDQHKFGMGGLGKPMHGIRVRSPE